MTNILNVLNKQKISELNEAEKVRSDDYFVIESVDRGTKKISSDNLLTSFERQIQEQKIYGIKRTLGNDRYWTRTDDAVGLTANATHDGSIVENDFDALYPWSDIITVNMDDDGTINAKYGEVGFRFDGENGEVMTFIPDFYWNRWQDDTYEYIQISNKPFINSHHSEAFYVGRYDTSAGHHSKNNVFALVSQNISYFRNGADAKGDTWSQMDYHYFLLQMLYLVEFGDNHSQSVLGSGISSCRYTATDTALVAESSTNRIIIASDNASYSVGTAICIGTSQGGTNVAAYRTITSKESYSSGGVTGTAINFDGDPVNIAVGNVLTQCGQVLGQCDALGMKSGCLNNDGRHAVIYRGIENIFGNVWQFVDGINIKDNVAYICYDNSKYVSNKFDEDYEELGYVNSNVNGYPQKMGYDYNHPAVALPVELNASASAGYCDYYYQNSGNRIALVGGAFYHGTYTGFFCWTLGDTSGNAHVSLGGRLLKKAV